MSLDTPPPHDPTPAGARPAWRGLLDGAARLGGYSWLETRLFQITGAWSTEESDPAVKLLLDAHSHQHAWHAEVWFARLPELREVDAPALVTAPRAEVAEVLDDLAVTGGTVERLTGLYRVVVPHLLASYRADLRSWNTLGDPSTRRWLGIVGDDLATSRQEGEQVLLGRLRRGEDVDVAAETQRRLERTLVLAGGPTGDHHPV